MKYRFRATTIMAVIICGAVGCDRDTESRDPTIVESETPTQGLRGIHRVLMDLYQRGDTDHPDVVSVSNLEPPLRPILTMTLGGGQLEMNRAGTRVVRQTFYDGYTVSGPSGMYVIQPEELTEAETYSDVRRDGGDGGLVYLMGFPENLGVPERNTHQLIMGPDLASSVLVEYLGQQATPPDDFEGWESELVGSPVYSLWRLGPATGRKGSRLAYLADVVRKRIEMNGISARHFTLKKTFPVVPDEDLPPFFFTLASGTYDEADQMYAYSGELIDENGRPTAVGIFRKFEPGRTFFGINVPERIGTSAAQPEARNARAPSLAVPPQSLIDQGIELSELGRHEEAIERFDMATSNLQDSTPALINRAVALSRLRRFQEAMATLESPLLREDTGAQEALDRIRSRPAPGTAEAGMVVLATRDDPVFPSGDNSRYDLTWVMATDAWGDEFNFEHNGGRFVKVGTSRKLHRDERDLMDPDSESLGLVYALGGVSSIVSSIERARVLQPPEQLGLRSSLETGLVHLQVGDRYYSAYTVVLQDVESGRFRWVRVRNGTEREFAAHEVVPPGFAPITSLRLAGGLAGMDGVDAVPQLNQRGVEELQRMSQDRVRLLGVPLLNRWKQGVVLARRGDAIDETLMKHYVVFYGDGHWRWETRGGRDPNAVEVAVVGDGDMGPVFVDPFDAPIWSYRRERVHNHRLGL